MSSNYNWSDLDVQKLKKFASSYVGCADLRNWCCIDFFSKAISCLYGGSYSTKGHMGNIVNELVKIGKA